MYILEVENLSEVSVGEIHAALQPEVFLERFAARK